MPTAPGATRHAAPASIRVADVEQVTDGVLGFRRVNRKLLAVGATVVCFLSVGIYDLQANAATTTATIVAPAPVGSQTLDVSASVAAGAVQRDGFEVTVFDEVQWPVDPDSFSGGYGPRSCAGCSSFHMGIDLNDGNGTPIEAAMAGEVVGVDTIDGSLGHHLVIESEINGETVYAVYAHMQSGSAEFGEGDEVSRGDVLGKIGATGQATAPHLHFALSHAAIGDFFDPMPWMEAHVTEEWNG